MVDFFIMLLHGILMMSGYQCVLVCLIKYYLNLTNIEGNHYKYYTSYYSFFNTLQSIICTVLCNCFLLLE